MTSRDWAQKPVTDQVLQRVALAIQQLAGDSSLPKTKRQIEKLTGLSHDAVARAFRWDRDRPKRYRLNERFDSLREPAAVQAERPASAGEEVDKLKAELAATSAALARFATTFMAARAAEDDHESNVRELPHR